MINRNYGDLWHFNKKSLRPLEAIKLRVSFFRMILEMNYVFYAFFENEEYKIEEIEERNPYRRKETDECCKIPFADRDNMKNHKKI